MEKLANALKAYDEDFALDIIGDYRRHFDEAAADGRSEESVCEELGSVEDFIRDIPEEFKKSSFKEDIDKEDTDKEDTEKENTDKKDADYTDDLGKLASDLGKLVNEAGKMAGKAGKAAGKAAIKAAKSADSAISRFSEVISDTINEAIGNKTGDTADEEKETDEEDMYSEGAAGEAQFEDIESFAENEEAESEEANPLVVCSYTGIKGLKMSVVEAHAELTQADTDAVTITLSRPLTKKEKMYMSPVVTIEDGILKVKQENRNKTFSFIYNVGNKPLIYYVNVPAKFEKINISTVSGSINVQSEIQTDSLKLSSVSGSIKTEYELHAEKLKLNTVSGTVNVAAQLYAKKQDISSVSGSIKAVVAGESFCADTVSGSVRLSIAGPCDGKVSTVSGSIVIKLLSDIGIDIKSSGMSGSMKLMTDKHVDWNNGEDSNTVHFGFSKSDRHAVFGSAMARVTTSAVSGSVKVYDFGKTE